MNFVTEMIGTDTIIPNDGKSPGLKELNRVTMSLEKDLSMSDSEEEDMSTDISDKEHGDHKYINKEKISVDLKKAFTEGWQRECLMREGRVSKVHYLSPRISARNQTRFQSLIKLRNYLVSTKSSLSIDNFTYEPKQVMMRS